MSSLGVVLLLFLGHVVAADETRTRSLELNGPPVTGALDRTNDIGYFQLKIPNEGAYELGTQGTTQVQLGLFGPTNQQLAYGLNSATDIRSSPDLVNARLRVQLRPGDYFVQVRPKWPGGAGEYAIQAVAANQPSQPSGAGATSPPPAVDDFEINPETTKLALVVGINKYQNNVIAPNLDGCENDADDMRNLLLEDFHFPQKNLIVLKSADATRKNIIHAFRNYLIGRAKKAQEKDASR